MFGIGGRKANINGGSSGLVAMLEIKGNKRK
jgi:hypothetical protein